jgi:hypothetical protein
MGSYVRGPQKPMGCDPIGILMMEREVKTLTGVIDD